jgi:membrane protease subunit HflK
MDADPLINTRPDLNQDPMQLPPRGISELAAQDVAASQLDPAQQSLAEALKVSFGILKVAMFCLLVAYAFSGTFSVGSNEVAVRLRFGDYVGAPSERVLERGTYLAAPFPVEQVIKVDTRPVTIELNKEFWYEVGASAVGTTRDSLRAGQARPLNPVRDGSLLTGDLNIAHARWSVTYRITDPVDYITNVGRPELGKELVRCAIQQAIVQTVAQTPADELLKGLVNRETALGIAQRQLDSMKCGFSLDTLSLDQVTAPMAVVASFDAVTSAESDRAQRIVAAQQTSARTLAETAGEAAEPLLRLVGDYEQASEGGSPPEAASVERAIDEAFGELRVGNAKIGGEAARIINGANTYRTQVVERIKSDRETFERLLPQYRENPRLVQSRLWEDTKQSILTGDVETFYTVPGNLSLKLNRDPEIQKDRQRQQLRDAKIEQRKGETSRPFRQQKSQQQ